MKMKLILCVNIVYRQICLKNFLLLTMKFINDTIYWTGTGKISSCLHRLLQEDLACAPAIILKTVFCKVKIFPLLEELPNKIIPYFITV